MLIGQIIDNRYKVTKRIGNGSFGETGIAIDTKFPGLPLRAVKQLCPKNDDPEALKIATRLFETEAKCLAKLGEHDRIPRLFAYFEENEEFFLVQELIEGQDLSQEFQPGKKWSEEKTVKFVKELLSILSVVHQQDTVHRDLKPANIMRRDSDGKLVLIDFGAVKEVVTVNREGQTTIPNPSDPSTVAIGTPGYMPPEQFYGKPGKYSDVYAVGMLGIQALTGLTLAYLPRDPDRFLEILNEQQIEVSPNFKSFLCKAIAYQFQNRYPNATKALQPLISTELNPEPPPLKKIVPKKILVGALSTVALIGGVGTYISQSLNKVNYAQLESHLQAQDWQQADVETHKIMLQVAREKSALDVNSISKFPCDSLQEIDNLWTTNSDGRFGFTPQEKVYLETGNEFNDYTQSTYEAFEDRIGWRTFGSQSYYGDLKFTNIAPPGHLPSPDRVAAGRKDLLIRERGDLLSRFHACNL